MALAIALEDVEPERVSSQLQRSDNTRRHRHSSQCRPRACRAIHRRASAEQEEAVQPRACSLFCIYPFLSLLPTNTTTTATPTLVSDHRCPRRNRIPSPCHARANTRTDLIPSHAGAGQETHQANSKCPGTGTIIHDAYEPDEPTPRFDLSCRFPQQPGLPPIPAPFAVPLTLVQGGDEMSLAMAANPGTGVSWPRDAALGRRAAGGGALGVPQFFALFSAISAPAGLKAWDSSTRQAGVSIGEDTRSSSPPYGLFDGSRGRAQARRCMS
jgi:hypothetical protein